MSYWCGEQLVVTIDGPAGRSVVSLAQPFARVGSHPAADVVLQDESVALRCVYLHATQAGVFCLYLDVETQDLDQKGTWLLPDQEILIGAFRLRASLLTAEPGDAPPDQSLAAWGSAPPPLPVMMVFCGQKLKDKRRFRAQLNPVGRRPQCALQLKGQKVSGFHCILFWEQGQLWCVDLNSSNGSQLNGAAIVCGRVNLGDRLDVGEFGLVFQRLSSGRSAADEPAALPATDLPTALPRVPQPQPTSRAAPEAAEPIPHKPSGPSPADLARAADDRRLREQMAEEVARLALEREEMHRQWEQSSQQLVAQIGQLHDEAARLTDERQALEQSRHDWQAERAALSEQLAERSTQLARLEAELAAATTSLAAQLAQVEARAAQSQLAPVAELPPSPSPAELARQAEDRNLREQLTAEVATLARERHDLQSHWEQTSQQLLSQIGQLHDEAGRLTGERQALEQSRQQWQGERAALSEQLAERSSQLSRLEAELGAATASLAEKLAQVEARAAQPPSVELPAGPSPAEQAREQEQRQLRDAMAAELDRLAREREAMHRQWEQSSQQLLAEVGQLHQEAARLTDERQALAQSRQEWQTERASLAEQLTQRSNHLARLESELAEATATLTDSLAQMPERAAQAPPSHVQSPPAAELTPEEETVLAPVGPVHSPLVPIRDEASSVPAPASIPGKSPPVFAPAPPAPDGDKLPLIVSERLLELGQVDRRRQLLWWLAGGVGVVAIVALAATVWMWIF